MNPTTKTKKTKIQDSKVTCVNASGVKTSAPREDGGRSKQKMGAVGVSIHGPLALCKLPSFVGKIAPHSDSSGLVVYH